MRLRGFLQRLVAASCLLLPVAGVAGVLVRGIGPEPGSLDPHLAQDLASFNLLFELYEGLVSETPDGKPMPGLASAWRVSADGLRWEFVLRPELRFSDGSPLTADDVVQSLRRALDPRLAAPYAGQLAALVAAPDVIAGRVPSDRLGVRAIAPDRVEMTLSTPLPQLPGLLMLPVTFPVHATLRNGARPDRVPVSGAFELAGRVAQSHLSLRANAHYHGAHEVRLAGQRLVITEDAHAELNRYRTGELHITETIPPGHYATLRAERGDELRVAPYLGTFWFGYNLTRPPFAGNPALREALSLAVDRRILVQHLTGAGEQPAWTLVPPGMPDWQSLPHPHAALSDDARVALARQRFAASGFAGRQLRVQIRYNSQPLQRRLALAVAAMWRQTLGVQAELHNEEWRVFVVNRRERRLTEAFRGGWIADYADPASFLELFQADSALNASGFDDAGYDLLLRRARSTADAAARRTLLAQAEQALMAQQPVLPLYFHVSRHLVSPRVRGWTDHPLDRHFGRYLALEP